ncbi:MAG: diaminopimelate epimerase [Fibrella sp.]|nr:diaminopimelate epimerase [Armatimonadota bacterium]
MTFTKMHGIGNDFVVADFVSPDRPLFTVEELQKASPFLCDRKFGVGADITFLVLPGVEGADFAMRMFNPDGSEAEMCGNGIRCFAKFVYDRGYTAKTVVTAHTPAGNKILNLSIGPDNKVSHVTVDMGHPGLTRADLPMEGTPTDTIIGDGVTIGGEETIKITGVSMGNPHVIYFETPATEESINRLGPVLETHPLFPRRTNVHCVEVISPDEIKMLTWERGAGRTLACGTGASASAVASHLNGFTGRRVLVHLAGGDLTIDWQDDDSVMMTGAATEVFTATIRIPDSVVSP